MSNATYNVIISFILIGVPLLTLGGVVIALVLQNRKITGAEFVDRYWSED